MTNINAAAALRLIANGRARRPAAEVAAACSSSWRCGGVLRGNGNGTSLPKREANAAVSTPLAGFCDNSSGITVAETSFPPISSTECAPAGAANARLARPLQHRCQISTSSSCRVRPYSTTSLRSSSATGGGGGDLATSPNATTLTSTDGVTATHPIDFDVASTVTGRESQIVTVSLEPGQVLRAESGAMMYMTTGVSMETTTGGGMSAGFKRMLTGQNVFISDYRYDGPEGTTGTVALGTDFPSKVLRLDLDGYGGKIVCQKGALLCASHTVDVEMEFAKKMTTGFFGGEGFVLQALTGTGDVFVKAGGTLIRKDLAEGETLRISSGCLVAFTQGVDYDVTTMPGFKNVLFGGEGLFVTTLTGPGTVWLQGMPPQRMVSEIARRVPGGGGLGLAVPIGGMGGGGGDGEAGEGGGEGGEEK